MSLSHLDVIIWSCILHSVRWARGKQSALCKIYMCTLTDACTRLVYARATCTDVVYMYTQGNPFIGAKRKRVPAVIRQTGCIIDRGIEFSLCPCLLRRPSFVGSLSFSHLYPLRPVLYASSSLSSLSLSFAPLFVCPIKSAGYECNEIAINASEYMHSADWLHKIPTVCAIFRR